MNHVATRLAIRAQRRFRPEWGQILSVEHAGRSIEKRLRLGGRYEASGGRAQKRLPWLRSYQLRNSALWRESSASWWVAERSGGDLMTLAFEASQFQLTDQGGQVTIALEGELDLAAAATLRGVLHGFGDQGKGVILDLSTTTFIDSTILGVLIGTARYFDGKPVSLVVRDPQPALMRVLAVTGVGAVLTVEVSQPRPGVTLV
jgi:anti-sigma B factor antagonist